jgi:hypothetical protein
MSTRKSRPELARTSGVGFGAAKGREAPFLTLGEETIAPETDLPLDASRTLPIAVDSMMHFLASLDARLIAGPAISRLSETTVLSSNHSRLSPPEQPRSIDQPPTWCKQLYETFTSQVIAEAPRMRPLMRKDRRSILHIAAQQGGERRRRRSQAHPDNSSLSALNGLDACRSLP